MIQVKCIEMLQSSTLVLHSTAAGLLLYMTVYSSLSVTVHDTTTVSVTVHDTTVSVTVHDTTAVCYCTWHHKRVLLYMTVYSLLLYMTDTKDWPSVHPSIHPPVSVSVRSLPDLSDTKSFPSVSTPVCLPVCRSVSQSVRLPVFMSTCVDLSSLSGCLCLHVCLSLHPSPSLPPHHLSLCLSVRPSL